MRTEPGILYNKKAAVPAMALMIIFACLFGTWRPLNKLRAEASALFWGNGNGDTISIEEDLKTKTGYAANLVLLANKYKLDAASLEKSIQQVNDSLTAADKIAANQQLNEAVKEIGEVILVNADRLNISDVDRRAYDSAYNHILSQEDIIVRSMNKYNDAAQQYNKELSAFPANIFGRIVNLRRL